MGLEVELKLRLPETEQQRLLRSPLLKQAESRTSARLLNIYYDTPDLALQCNGIALRRRRSGRRWLQTVKCTGMARGGLSTRPEWEQPFVGDFDFNAIDDAALKKRLERARARLVPVFESNFLRTAWTIRAGGTLIELALDRGAIGAKGRTEAISEVELELRQGDVAGLLALAARLAESFALAPASLSKAQRGYRLFLDTPQKPWHAIPTAIDATMTPRAALRSIADNCLDQLNSNHEGALHCNDPEYIHQMRVAVRRLRAVLRLFRPQLPADFEAKLKPPLMALMKSLGAARDLDVLLSEIVEPVARTMPGEPRIGALADAATGKRAHAREQAIAYLGQPEYGRTLLLVMTALNALPQNGQSPDVDLPAFAKHRLSRLHRKVLQLAQLADIADPASLHRLRIGVKRLRYALEFFAPLLQARRTVALTKRLVALQDTLGQLNDLANAGAVLMGCAGERPDLREAVSLIGGWHAQRHVQLLGKVPRAIAKLKTMPLPKLH